MITTQLSAIRGTDWAIQLPPLGSIASRTKLYLTARARLAAPDRRSVLQVEETAGLIHINGHTADTPALGDIVVLNPATGLIRLDLDASMSTLLAAGEYNIDVKMITASDVTLLVDPVSTLTVRDPVTQAIA